MAGRKSDFTLTKLDDLFSTQEQRDEEKLSKIRGEFLASIRLPFVGNVRGSMKLPPFPSLLQQVYSIYQESSYQHGQVLL